MEKRFNEWDYLDKKEEGKKCYTTPDGYFWFSDEEFEQMREKFFRKFPDCPRKAKDLECLELTVNKDVFDAIKNGSRRAVVVYGGTPESENLYDQECIDYIVAIDKKHNNFWGNWCPTFCNGRRPVKTIKFICGEDTMTVIVKEQGWAFPMDDEDYILRDEYGCPDPYLLAEERYTLDARERRIAAGENINDVWDEEPDYHYFIF